jgi:hypothetical protein
VLATCASEVFGEARREAGMPVRHDDFKCKLRPINPADYAGGVPPPTAADLMLLPTVFPQGVCDYSSITHAPSVQWLTYQNGPGGEPLGPVPSSTAF